MNEYINNLKMKFEFEHPIVGIHVRRTSKKLDLKLISIRYLSIWDK
jgi:hypothetical protein